jgi:hypothetical protein
LTLFFRRIDPCFLFFFFSMTVLSSFNIYGLKRDKNKVKSRNVKTIKNMNHYKKNKTWGTKLKFFLPFEQFK